MFIVLPIFHYFIKILKSTSTMASRLAANNITHLCLLELVHKCQAEAITHRPVAHIANLNMMRILLTCNMAMSIARRAYEPIPPEYTCIVSTTFQIWCRGMTIFLEEKNDSLVTTN